MLEKLDLTKTLEKENYKEKMGLLVPELGKLQRECKELGIPVMIAFEGYGAAGKGVQIGELIKALDPRGFEVYAVKTETQEEKLHPFLWRFWTKMPAKGRIAIYDSSWYRKVLVDRFDKKTKKEKVEREFASICSFEEQLTADGMVIIKIFLAIDKGEQRKRFDKLLESEETAWRVSIGDLKLNERVEEAKKRKEGNAEERGMKELSKDKVLGESILNKADLSLAYTKEEYKEQLSKLQKKIEKLHGELYRRRIPVVLGFEGWDAGGKGGAIKRLTEKMDPRGYVVHPTASPNDVEKAHHYLWRFWVDMPKAGHVTIFDRTWYGRVMVERIEGFCTKAEWQRAYKEINDMERDLTDAGAIVLKFWMHIDKNEQERRFKARQENPEKQWKITDEDWRNREKWELYEEAVNEMILRTSTKNAPWIVVEGNCKYYARIKVLKIVIEAIEERLKEV